MSVPDFEKGRFFFFFQIHREENDGEKITWNQVNKIKRDERGRTGQIKVKEKKKGKKQD